MFSSQPGIQLLHYLHSSLLIISLESVTSYVVICLLIWLFGYIVRYNHLGRQLNRGLFSGLVG